MQHIAIYKGLVITMELSEWHLLVILDRSKILRIEY